MTFIVAQIVGVLALTLSIIGSQQNTDKKFLFFQILINVLYSLQYFLLNATAGLSICLINTIRCVIFYFCKKKEKSSILALSMFVILYLILGIYTANNLFDIVLMSGTIIYTYALWQLKMKVTRLGSFVSIASYIVYNVAVKAYSALILDFIDLISISVAIVRYDILNNNRKTNCSF